MNTNATIPIQSFVRPLGFLRRHSTFLLGLACAALTAASQAEFSTGFEMTQSLGSPAYASGATIIGIQDKSAPSGKRWMNLFDPTNANATNSKMVLATSTLDSGALGFQINDASDTTAYATCLDLSGTDGLDLTRSFTISFSMNLAVTTATSDNQAQIYLGAADTNYTTSKYWASLLYNNGDLRLLVKNASGSGSSWLTLATYSSFVNATNSNYVTVSITIDPVSKKYTKVVLSGNGVTNDCTTTVQASNGGYIPWLPGVNTTLPAANLLFATGTNDKVVAKFDSINIANANLWYQAYAPGVILPTAGTIEMTMALSRPITQFGNSYDFIFKMMPAQKIDTGDTLMGVCVPTAGVGTGLLAVVRNAISSSYVTFPGFSRTVGQKTRVAMSWGSNGVRLYIGGSLAASTTSPGAIAPIPAQFLIGQLDPFNVSEVKVSDMELTAATTPALSGAAETPMTADSHTTLLANNNLQQTQYFHTTAQAAYHSLTPVWRDEDQSLVSGTTPTYKLVGVNHTAASKTYSVKIESTNLSGTKSTLVDGYNVGLASGPYTNNAYNVRSIALPGIASPGFYKLHTTITSPDSVVTSYDSAIAVFPANPAVSDGSCATFLGHHYPIQDSSAVVLNRMGIKTNRIFGDLSGFYWFAVQPNSGTGTTGFTWARTDLLVQQAKTAGIELVGLLGNPPTWAAADPGVIYKASYSNYSKMSGHWKPADSSQWGNYVYQVVNRYKNDVKNWEIWNEVDWHPNAPYYSFSGTTAEYRAFLKTAYDNAKSADSTCNVLMSGFSLLADQSMPTDLLTLEKNATSTAFDTFASHGYVNSKIDSLNNALEGAKPGAPHWMTEQMWDAISYERDRLFLTVELFMRYLDKNVDRFYQFSGNGFCFDQNTFSPKIDTYVQAVFQNQMRKANVYNGKYSFTGSDGFALRHYFTRTDNQILSILGSELATNKVTVTGTVVSAVDLYGKPVSQTVVGGSTVLTIKDAAYIISSAALAITGIETTERAPLLLNTGFEDVDGDIGAGLQYCTPSKWTLRKTDYDPLGQINMTESEHTGTYGVTMYCSGGNQPNGQPKKVYVFQDVRVATAGTYTATAWVKRVNAGETAIPFLLFYNRDTDTVTTQNYPSVVAGGDYTQVTYTLHFTEPLTQSAALSVGVQGAGTVLADDVTFVRTGD